MYIIVSISDIMLLVVQQATIFGIGHSEMSFDGRFGSSDNSHSGSRHSNTLARLAFNIYGSGSTGSTGSTSSASPNRSPYAVSRQSPPAFISNPTALSSSIHGSHGKESVQGVLRYRSTQELIGLSKINDETSDAIVVAGKNLLEIVRVDANQFVPVNDLLSDNYYMKNKKVMGSIIDVKCGYQNYSKFIATSTTTGSVFIFNNTTLQTKKVLHKLSEHTRAVNTISFSQLDPSLLLSGSQDGAVKLWDLRSNSTKSIATMNGNSEAVRCIQFSPFHNKKMAAIFDSGVIQKWDLRNPSQFERKLNAHTGPGLSIDWHPDLDYLVSGGRDKQIQVWNMSNTELRSSPEHVIHTSAPVNKVCFKPNLNGITNIQEAEIGTSFLTNDLSIQIYSLKRKYIPQHIIERHRAQVTGLLFREDGTLLSCSKDKYILKEDLLSIPYVVDNMHLSATSWSANNNLIFVQQKKTDDEKDPFIHEYSTNLNPPSSSAISTSPTSGINISPNSQVNLGTHGRNTGKSSPSFTDSSPRPGMSRASSYKPPLLKHHSHGSYHNHGGASTNPGSVANTYAIPVSLPIFKTRETLKYLSDNYVIDNKRDLLEVCDINSRVANDVQSYRDARTWTVIKECLVWESQLGDELKYQLDHDEGNITEITVQNANISDSISVNEGEYHYSTSNSTNYGRSPILSDLSEFNSLNSREISKESLKPSSLRKSFSGISKVDEHEEDAMGDDGRDKTVTKDDLSHWKEEDEDSRNNTITAKPNIDQSLQDPNEEAVEFVSSVSQPMPLSFKRKPRDSILESILPHESHDSELLARSSSPSYSVSSSFSNPSSLRPVPMLPALKGPHFSRLTKQESHVSELTKQLTDQKLTQEEEEAKSHELLPPYAPKSMIKKAIEFSSSQGDLIMSCTLILLFNEKYKLCTDLMVKNTIQLYLDFLKSLQLFTTCARVIDTSNFDDFRELSLNSTTLRIFCFNCGELIVNERTKQNYLKDKKVQFGAWYCDNCGEQSRCIYCNEPVKGLNVFRLKCGHNGHFDCFKSWLIDEQMDCCPGGCID